MLKFAVVEIGHHRQPDMRVGPHIDSAAGQKLGRSHLIEEDKWPDHLPRRSGQCATDFKAGQTPLYFLLFALGAAGELAIPVLAEWKTTANWHRGHIVDRHNMFNIIVLGECFAAIAMIVADSRVPDPHHFWLAGLCFLSTLSMWGLYFDRNEQLLNRKLAAVLTWAYGHYVLFAASAATAAGFSVALTVARERSLTSTRGPGSVRADGRVTYDISLYQVKSPSESKAAGTI